MTFKLKPSYDLNIAKELIKFDDSRHISLHLIKVAHCIGYSEQELIDFFLSLERKDFTKSETQHWNNNNNVWQDYYSKFDGTIHIFIKFKIKDHKLIILTSFHENEKSKV